MSSSDDGKSVGGGDGESGTGRKLGSDDFGYSFVAYEPPPTEAADGGGGGDDADKKPAAVASGDDGAGVGDGDPYVYEPPRKWRLRRQRSEEDIYTVGTGGYSGGEAFAAANAGFVCCCLAAVLIAVGGILLVYEQAYKVDGEARSSHLLFAGSVCLIVAAAACLCGCTSMCAGCVAAVSGRGGGDSDSGSSDGSKEVKVRLRRLNGRTDNAEDALNMVKLDVVGGLKEVKEARKREAKERKEKEKKEKEELEKRVKADLEAGKSVKEIGRKFRPVCFLAHFSGNTSLSGMDLLRKQVSLIVTQGRRGVDQAVFVVTSPGGEVSAYGLAASQLVRIRKAGIHLVVCVDSIAASGGYMMASVADRICAAPFAIVGSVGVVAQIPNFHRFLDKNDIDAYVFTAGRYKRTVDVIGEVTEEGKAKFKEDLEDIHRAFRDHVALARPALRENIEDVATGEHWLAVQAKEMGLVDEIMTSDEYLDSVRDRYDIVEIIEKKKKKSALYGAVDVRAAVSRGVEAVVDGLRESAEKPRPSYKPMAIS